ncbi:hypothetical protein ACFXOD_31560 [Streptomyces sp. NPDC059161]|uniref:hypothetical protein n=1 Tax=Streptomyces sp. NPDC059161 TaxID=3346749 RepID=UPI0036950728
MRASGSPRHGVGRASTATAAPVSKTSCQADRYQELRNQVRIARSELQTSQPGGSLNWPRSGHKEDEVRD